MDPSPSVFLAQNPSIVCTRLQIVSSLTHKRFFVKLIRRLTKIFNKDGNQDRTKQRSQSRKTQRGNYQGKSSPSKVNPPSQSIYFAQITNAGRFYVRIVFLNHHQRHLATLLLSARTSPIPTQATAALSTWGRAQSP